MYLDYNSTSKPSREVLEAMILTEPLNPSSIHSYGRKARAILEETRTKLSKIFRIPKGYRTIFTSSATEANNLFLNSCDKVFASATEHPSILKNDLAGILPVTREGLVDFEKLTISPFRVYAIMLANNETGVINPIKEIAEKVRKAGALLQVDSVQAPGKIALDLEALGADAYSISSHKMGGPFGIGCLIYNQDKISLKALIRGGGQEFGLRSGTENIQALRGFSVALDQLEVRLSSMKKIQELRDWLELEIKKTAPEIIVFGAGAPRLPNTLSINLPGVKSEVQVAYFDSHGIAVSAGAACSAGRVEKPLVQMAMGYSYEEAASSLRISLGPENRLEEIKFFLAKWQELYQKTKNYGQNFY
jgi:cysteine desulfurase